MIASTADDPWEQPVPRRRYALYWATQWGLWLALYLAVNVITAGRSVAQPLLPGEERLPLVRAVYPFYALLYLEVLLPLLLAPTRRRYVVIHVACALAAIVAFAVFLVAPMEYPRPAHPGDGVAGALLRALWFIDQPRNTFPSLHVATAWIMWAGLRDRSRRWAVLLLASAVAVSVSTVLLEQHFAVDVLGGMALAALAWRLAPRAAAALILR